MSERFCDPVVAEVHATRAAMLEAAGGSIAELMQQVADRQQRSYRRIIREPLRNRLEPGPATMPPSAVRKTEASSVAAQ